MPTLAFAQIVVARELDVVARKFTVVARQLDVVPRVREVVAREFVKTLLDSHCCRGSWVRRRSISGRLRNRFPDDRSVFFLSRFGRVRPRNCTGSPRLC